MPSSVPLGLGAILGCEVERLLQRVDFECLRAARSIELLVASPELRGTKCLSLTRRALPGRKSQKKALLRLVADEPGRAAGPGQDASEILRQRECTVALAFDYVEVGAGHGRLLARVQPAGGPSYDGQVANIAVGPGRPRRD